MTRRSFFRAGAAGAAIIARAAAAAPANLRVAQVEPVILRGSRRQAGWLIVRVKTNEGIEGVGECSSPSSSTSERVRNVRDMVESIGLRLAAAGNPLLIWSHLEHWFHEANGPEWASAMAGIEIALWDILGQVAGLPLYQVLGGAVRDQIPLCANGGGIEDANGSSARLEWALKVKEAGFRMLKWDPWAQSPDRAYQEIRQFREALGPDFRLAMDANGRFTPDSAPEVLKRLQDFDPAFIEEPVPESRLEWHKPVAAGSRAPLAFGKRLSSYREAKLVVDAGGLGILQPDVGACGGVAQFSRIAGYADICGLRLAPHAWCGPVVNRANTHVSAIAAGLIAQQYPVGAAADAQDEELIEPPARISGGGMVLPQGPGLGFKLNEKALKARRIV